ncbi:MAG: pitrilysin family protein, partial [Pseudomonadota bacterium]
ADLEAYRKRVFARDTLKIAVVGDIDAKTLGPLLDKLFGDLVATADLNPVPEIAPVTGGVNKVVTFPVPQSVAIFGMGSISRTDRDFIPAFVMNHILGGGGFSSKLMQEVREKRGLAYSVYSYLQPFDRSSIFAGGVATKNDKIGESLTIIREQFQQMADNGPDPADLKAAIQYLTGSYALRFDTNSKVAQQLLGILQDELGLDYIKERNDLIRAVTAEDVKRAADRIIKTDDLIVTVVGNPVGWPG